MQNTSEQHQYVGSSPLRSRAQRSGVLVAALALVLGTLAALVPGIVSPIAAGAATTPVTWNTALTCGTYDYAVVPPGTTSITATIYGGGGGGGAGSGTGGTTAGNGGPAGSTTVTYAVTPGSDVGVDIGCGGGAGSTVPSSTPGGGGAGASGYTAGGSGGNGGGSSSDPGAGGGAGGGSTGLCLGTTSGCTTPISIAPGGAGGGAAGGNNGAGCGNATAGAGGTGGGTGTTGGAGGAAGAAPGTAGGNGVAGTADTGDTGGSGVGGSGGGAGNAKSGGTKAGPGGGGGGGTGGAGGTNSTGGGTAGTGGANDTGGGGGVGANGGGAVGLNNGVGTGGTGGSTTSGTGNNMNVGGGGGGGGYTGGGGGGSTYCSGSDLSGAGGGGGGAGWSSSTATATSSAVASGTSASCTGTGTSNGVGGTGATTPAAGNVGCAGEVSSATFTGTAPGTPTESGSLSYTIGTAQSTATYTATGASSCNGTSTYCEFTLASGALPTGLTLNTSTGVISGTASGTAGNYTFTVSATNPYGTSTATATQTLVLAAGATKLAFSATPGTTNNGVTFSAQPVVKVENASGTTVTSSSASVSLAIASGTGTLNCTTNPVTAVSGIATFAGCEITGTAGTNFSLIATSTGLTSVTSSTFTISGTLKLAFTATPGTTANGVAFSTQPVVKIENSGSTVVTTASAPITLSVASGSGTLSCTTNPVTATAGAATFAGCAITGTAGAFKLSATSTGLTSVTSTSFTINAGAATQLNFTTSPGTTNNGVTFSAQPVVQVQDASGNVVTSSSASVSLSIASGTGTLNCTTNPVTATSGTATFAGCEITGTAGTNFSLSATSTGLTGDTSNTFTITGTLKLVFTTTPGTTNNGVAFSAQPVVKIENSSNTVVTTASAPITLAIGSTNAGGTLACTTNPVTATAGVATFAGCAITGTAGSYNLSATSTGLTSGASTSFTINPGSATQLDFTTSPGNSTNGVVFSVQPVVKVEDASGNVVTSSSASIILTPSSGTLTCTTNPLNATAGVASFAGCSLTGTATSGYSLSAASTGLTGDTSSPTFALAVGAATQLNVTTSPGTTANGVTFGAQPVVEVQDSGGNVVTSSSASISLSIASGTGTLNCTTNPLSATSGVATFAGCEITGTAGTNFSLGATSTGLTGDTSNTFTITGTLKLIFTTTPGTTNNGVVFSAQPVVRIENSSNVVVTTASAPITLGVATGSGTLNCTTNPVTAASGVATFAGCAITGMAGGYTLSAASTGLTTGASTSFTINPGTATQLVFTTSPGNSTNGVAFTAQPVVKVEDASGNVVTSSSASISLTPSSGTLTCTANPLNASSGVASFAGCSLTGTATSGYSLSATSGGLPGATSSPTFSLAVGAAAQLDFTTSPGNSTNGVAFSAQPVVKVEDSGGNVVTSSSASISLTPSSGTLTCTTNPLNASSGVATFAGCSLTGTAGSGYSLSAASTGLTGDTSSPTFALAVGAATKLVFTTSPGNSTNGVAFSAQPVVKVEDSGGNVVSSSSASISLSPSSGALSCTTNPLNASSGVATFAGCSLTGTAGSGYSLSAASSGLTGATSSPTFALAVGAATKLVFTTSPGNSTNGVAFSAQPVVKVEDSGGNVVSSSSASISLSPSSGALSCTTNPLNASSGVASFAGCSLAGTAGSGYSLSAASSGLTGATSSPTFSLSVGAATQLVFTTSPGTTANGVAFSAQPVVKVEDSGGNVVTGSSASVSLSLASGAGTLGGCTTNPVTALSGVATFAGCAITGTAGSGYSLSASSSGLTGATSSSFSLSTGAATQLVFTTSPGNSTNGVAFSAQPVVEVEDSGGNVVTSSSASISLTPSSGALTCTTNPLSASSGVANFAGCSLAGTAGSGYSLSATSSGVTAATSSPFSLATGAATQLEFTTSPVGNAVGTTTFVTSPVVGLFDSGGNLVTAFSGTVTLATTSGSPAAGTLSCTNAGGLTAAVASGYATFSGCQIVGSGLPATYQLQTTSTGLTSATSSSFTVNPGPATQLVFTSAPSSQAAAPVAGTTAFVVQAEDAYGNPAVNTGSAATVTVATTSTGTTFFTTTSGGSTGSGTISIPNDSSSSNSFYYADDTAGTWSISATATVDGNGASTSPDATVVIAPASPTLTASGPATGNAGTAIDGSTVSSTMVGSSGTNATAPITFTVFGPGSEPTSCTSGGTTLGTATPAGDGTYTSSGTFTPSVAGNYWWYASSAGDANNNAAASACASGMSETVVAPASPTLTASGPATGNAGTAIDGSTVSSTMVGSSGTNATAPITFTVFGPGSEPTSCTSGGTTLGTATPAGDGTYTSSGTFTPSVAGNYWWYASSAGDANNNAAASACASGMSETVVAEASPTLTASGPATGNAGTAIDGSTVSSTMVGSSGTNATAPITFTVFGPGSEPTSCTSGGTTLGTATPAGDGTYTSSGTFTPSVAGNYWWYASSAGDANNNAAASACASGMSETVVAAPISATVVTSTANPAAYQTAVTLTATVTGTSGLGAPTGTVAFTDSSSNPLTCASGSDSTLSATGSTTSSATCIYTPPASGGVGGAFGVVGTYSGDSEDATSFGGLTQNVTGTYAISDADQFSADPSPYGALITMTGTLTDPSSSATPTGTVNVIDGATGVIVCSQVPLTSSAPYTANFSCTFAPDGTGGVGAKMTMWIEYPGDANFAHNSRSDTVLEAGTASTTPSVTASPTTVPVGASTTLQATLTGSPAPTGNVTFLDDGTPISGCGLIVVQSGVAQSKCAYSPGSVGSHSITVVYSGNVNYAAAGPSAAATVVVTGATTSETATPTLVSPLAPVPNADPITVSTVVSGSGATPTGTVAFSATIGSSTSTPCVAAPLNGSGTASCTFTPAFAAGAGGAVSITAVYSGDGTYSQSTSGTLSVNVLAIGLPSTFTLTTTKSPLTVGSSATLTAQLTGSPRPGGTVSFTDNGSPLPCGAVTVNNSTGKATCAYTPAWGTHALVATYSGNATYAPITASTVGFANSATLVVNSTGVATVAVTSSANPSATGAAITFGATITGTLSPVPTGTVTFSATIGSSTTTACAAVAVRPSTGTSATAGCTYTPPDSGNTITITAAYSGNPTYAPQSGTFTQTELGTAAPATFTLTTTKSPLTVGSSATLTATLKGSPTPGGTVSFTDNGSPLSCGAVTLGNTGKAACAYTPAWGSHALVATYSGNATYAPITASTVGFANSATLVVNSTGVSTVAVTSSANPSAYGATVTLTATVTGALSSAPTGTIAFTTSVGTLASGCAAAGLMATGPSTSAAMCVLTPPTSGTGVIITVNASYSGNPTYAPEAAAAFSQTEAGAETPSITLTSSANPAAPGTEVTFTAAFTGTVKPGTVTFTDNGTAVCTAVAIPNSGKATCVDMVSGASVHTIVAAYTGNATYAARQVTLNETVN